MAALYVWGCCRCNASRGAVIDPGYAKAVRRAASMREFTRPARHGKFRQPWHAAPGPADARAGARRVSPMIGATAGTRRSAALAAQLSAMVPANTTEAFTSPGRLVGSIANCSHTINR